MRKPKYIPTQTLEHVTPELAKQWLEQTKSGQRNVSKFTVNRYAEEMKSDEWVLTHQGIAFDIKGRLCDGQHRLRAIVAAKKAIWTLVFRGVDPVAFVKLDGGKVRGPADVLSTIGEKDTTKLSGLLTYVARWNAELATFNAVRIEFGVGKTEKINVFNSAPEHVRAEMNSAVARSRHYKQAGCTSSSMWTAMIFVTSLGCGGGVADEFFDNVIRGAGLAEDDPRLTLRNRLQNNATASRRMSTPAELECIIRAWNAWRDRRPLRRLVTDWTSGYAVLPSILGCEMLSLTTDES